MLSPPLPPRPRASLDPHGRRPVFKSTCQLAARHELACSRTSVPLDRGGRRPRACSVCVSSSSCGEHERAAGAGGPDDGRGRRPRRRPYDRLRQAAHGPVALELRPRPRLEGRAAADAAEASSDTSFEFSAVVSYSSSSPASMVFSGRGTRRAAACWGAWGRPAGRRAAKSMDAGKGAARAARGGRHDGGLGMGAAEGAAGGGGRGARGGPLDGGRGRGLTEGAARAAARATAAAAEGQHGPPPRAPGPPSPSWIRWVQG